MEESSLLHKNLTLLIQFHNPPKEFLRVFKEGMFLQTNKEGMLYTLNFLLPILKPDVFKKDISWPIHTKEEEAAFRRAVLKFLTDYNSKYELIKLPKIATSILSTAGGLKFITFMLDLSTVALTVVLRKRNKKEFDTVLGGFASLDRQEQLSRYEKLKQKSDQDAAEFERKQQELENTIQKNRQEAQKLKEENDHLMGVLTKVVDDTNCILESDKKSCTDPEIRACVDNRLTELDIRENIARVRIESINEFSNKIHEISTAVKAIFNSKTQDVKLDGSEYSPEALSPYTSRLTSKGLLTPNSNFFVNGQITLGGLMELCACSCADLIDLAREILEKKQNPSPEKPAEFYRWALLETNALKEELLELEEEQKVYLAHLDSSIERSNAILLNFELNPRYGPLLAPSPQVTMTPEFDLEDSKAEFESPMDSPYVQNYAKKLLERVKANVNAAKFGESSGNQTPISSFDRRDSSESYLARFNTVRITKPGTFRSNFDEFLDRSLGDTVVDTPTSTPRKSSPNEAAANESSSSFHLEPQAFSSPACTSFEPPSSGKASKRRSLDKLIEKYRILKSNMDIVPEVSKL